ncbi:hypothetical protein GUJ93_ZPchr0047g2823 [Zizania palustris]|uniref:BZIP domain-containing protein n=1 Tax=Zizania palustris TaxID=103762 RepID=A0A8J5RSU3_ZIZPA|nr:hypothetical protein GUJ93_ZPchr0047g2823 [Zizania palustris]
MLRDHDHGMDKRSSDESGNDQKVGIERKEGVPPKHAQSEADTKRAKQQYAQRSRVRKLQYIAELERKVQALQSEGTDTLESLAQEQLIKRFQQEMLSGKLAVSDHCTSSSSSSHNKLLSVVATHLFIETRSFTFGAGANCKGQSFHLSRLAKI